MYEVFDAPHAKQKTPAQQGLVFANVHPEPPPALSAVCRESRYFVLHHYKPLTLGSTTKYVDLFARHPTVGALPAHQAAASDSALPGQIPLLRRNINRLALGTSYGVYTGICHPVLQLESLQEQHGQAALGVGKVPAPEDAHLSSCIRNSSSSSTFAPPLPYRRPRAFLARLLYPTRPVSMPVAPPAPRPAAPSSGRRSRPPFCQILTRRSRLSHQRPLPARLHHSTCTHASPPAATLQAPQFAPRPQLVHQAYRFKFDIEANINYTPRRPHLNELLYYPLDIDGGQ